VRSWPEPSAAPVRVTIALAKYSNANLAGRLAHYRREAVILLMLANVGIAPGSGL
jgi:hypothetical protein